MTEKQTGEKDATRRSVSSGGEAVVEYHIDPAEEKAVLRKIDWIVMPAMTFVYFFQCKSCGCFRPLLGLVSVPEHLLNGFRPRQADNQLRFGVRPQLRPQSHRNTVLLGCDTVLFRAAYL
jgi:hypothetical protein